MKMQGSDLAHVPLFAALTDAERDEIAASMRIDTFPEGAAVLEEGDLSYKFLVILEGSARAERDGVQLRALGPGDFFGEGGIVRKEHRNADVVATAPLRLGVLFDWSVRDLMHRYPVVASQIKAAAKERT